MQPLRGRSKLLLLFGGLFFIAITITVAMVFTRPPLSEEAEFYHFEAPYDVVKRGEPIYKATHPRGVSVLDTPVGAAVVRNYEFTPNIPLPESANVYLLKKVWEKGLGDNPQQLAAALGRGQRVADQKERRYPGQRVADQKERRYPIKTSNALKDILLKQKIKNENILKNSDISLPIVKQNERSILEEPEDFEKPEDFVDEKYEEAVARDDTWILQNTATNVKRLYHNSGTTLACANTPCKQYLSNTDLRHFEYCYTKSNMSPVDEIPTCNFRVSGVTTALAAPPGAGTDQLRNALQTVTGLCTGSTTCNTRLRRSGFTGEYVRSGAVLIVKTHQIWPSWGIPKSKLPRGFSKVEDLPAFESGVFLLRNPYHAMLEEWGNRHLDFGESIDTSKWETFVWQQVILWKKLADHWLVQDTNYSIMITLYENLQSNTASELWRILNFLDARQKYSAEKLDKYQWEHRNPTREQLSVFSAKQIEYINFVVGYIDSILKILYSGVDISSYYAMSSAS